VIVPIAAHKPGVLDKAREVAAALGEQFRVKLDESDKMPGWKFAEYEMKGVPLRLEIGPRDLENNHAWLSGVTTAKKPSFPWTSWTRPWRSCSMRSMPDFTPKQKSLNSRIYDAADWDNFTNLIAQKPGFVRAMWCGDLDCELKIKEETTATSRCLPFGQETIGETCVCCGKPADKLVIWGKAY
jgi:prolyl-tRNA synthetase